MTPRTRFQIILLILLLVAFAFAGAIGPFYEALKPFIAGLQVTQCCV